MVHVNRFRHVVSAAACVILALAAADVAAWPDHIEWSSYLGGSGAERPYDVVCDTAGNVYVSVFVTSVDFPLLNAFDITVDPLGDAAVVKIGPDGTLLFSSYLGGTAREDVGGIAVDDSGYIYVTGYTFSSDFPTTDSYDPTFNSGGDVFVTKIDPVAGAIVWSTFIGGSSGDHGMDIVLRNGKVYVGGYTYSSNFPLVNPVQASHGGREDFFVARLSADGETLEFSTYLGGSEYDRGISVDADNAGNMYICGYSESDNFPTAAAVQSSRAYLQDIAVAKIAYNNGLYQLVYSTYLGGDGDDSYCMIAANPSTGEAYVHGWSNSTDFPLFNAIDTLPGSGPAWTEKSVFTKLDANGQFVFSSYWGMYHPTHAREVFLTPEGNPVLVGQTRVSTYPLVNPIDSISNSYYEGYVSVVSSDGQTLLFSTFLGGVNYEEITGGCILPDGSVCVVGRNFDGDYPMVDAFDDTYGGSSEGFVTMLSETVSCCVGLRGDVDGDSVNADPIDLSFLVDFLFGAGTAPSCAEEADINGDSVVADPIDLSFLVDFLFSGGTAPAACP